MVNGGVGILPASQSVVRNPQAGSLRHIHPQAGSLRHFHSQAGSLRHFRGAKGDNNEFTAYPRKCALLGFQFELDIGRAFVWNRESQPRLQKVAVFLW